MNFLGMGPMELLLIVILALIVFGPSKLPEIMGQVGKAVNDFRKATTELTDEFNKTLQSEIEQTKAAVSGTAEAVVTTPAPQLALAPGATADSPADASVTTAESATEASPAWHWEDASAKPPESGEAPPNKDEAPDDGASGAKSGVEKDLLPPY